MAGFAWFQEGTTYGAADLASFNAQMFPMNGFAHLLGSTSQFLLNSDQTARTVAVGAGNAAISNPSGGVTWAWSPGGTVAVPAASSVNPRRDLIVARLMTKAIDGANGVAVELIAGSPAATPSAPTRPDNAVALGWVDVPKSSTAFTLTVTRHTGQYRDQGVISGPGTIGIDWAGQLPSGSAVRAGAIVVDLGTNQRWMRTNAGTWFTTDPGPWRACTLQNVQAKDGTNVTVGGVLYVREDSTKWELSGQLTFAPSTNLAQLVLPALLPSGVTRPTQNTYGASGQTFGSTSTGGVGRIALMSNGAVEYGNDGTISNLYVNEQFSKSPYNTSA
ncbi:hypothetical protein ACFQ7F_12985 [Streptomyces sp. NPDC056486]|uniref:hypothetical protein n=1 Tax=Streptomyces sp. NPDC056486 TaxID=3345835 RepID=UPI0036855D29